MSISLVCLHRHVFIAKWFNTKFGIHKCVCQRVGTLFVAIFYMYMIVLLSQMIIKKLLPQTKSLIYVEFEMTKMQEIEILFWYSH